MPLLRIPYPAKTPLGHGVERAVAFGGGGEWFTSFCLAYIHSLAAHGIDLRRAELTVGTSAGSIAGALLTAGKAESAFHEWLGISQHPDVLTAQVKTDDPTPSQQRALGLLSAASDTEPATVRDLGRAAMAARNQPIADYEAAVVRLTGGLVDWPSPAHHTTAVDCYTGERVVVGPDSGIPISTAIAASTSLPGTAGPTWLDDTLAMDGGVSRSSTHADLLVGARRVVIFTLLSLTAEQVAVLPATPFGLAERAHPGTAEAERALIEAAGGRAMVVVGDPPPGISYMDPTQLAGAMEQGAIRAESDREVLARLWNE